MPNWVNTHDASCYTTLWLYPFMLQVWLAANMIGHCFVILGRVSPKVEPVPIYLLQLAAFFIYLIVTDVEAEKTLDGRGVWHTKSQRLESDRWQLQPCGDEECTVIIPLIRHSTQHLIKHENGAGLCISIYLLQWTVWVRDQENLLWTSLLFSTCLVSQHITYIWWQWLQLFEMIWDLLDSHCCIKATGLVSVSWRCFTSHPRGFSNSN